MGAGPSKSKKAVNAVEEVKKPLLQEGQPETTTEATTESTPPKESFATKFKNFFSRLGNAIRAIPYWIWENGFELKDAYSEKEKKAAEKKLSAAMIFKQLIGWTFATIVVSLARLAFLTALAAVACAYFLVIFGIANAISPGLGSVILTGSFLSIAIPAIIVPQLITIPIFSEVVKSIFSGPIAAIKEGLSFLINKAIGNESKVEKDKEFKYLGELCHKAAYNAAGYVLSLPGKAMNKVFGVKAEEAFEEDTASESDPESTPNNVMLFNKLDGKTTLDEVAKMPKEQQLQAICQISTEDRPLIKRRHSFKY